MESDAAQSDNYIRFVAWAQANQKRLIIAAVVVVLAVAVISIVVYQQGQKEVRASHALASVPAPLNPGTPMRSGSAEAYMKVAREYEGTKAGARALLQAAAAYFTETNYVQAQKTFEDFLKEHPGSQWAAQAHFGVAASLDAQGKNAEATAKFEEIRRRFANEPVIDEVKLALGRLYENQNKPADAHKLYSELVQNNPYTGIGSEAGVRKEDLEVKHPELARTNAPMLTPPPLTMATTNRPATTNRVITLSNAVRAATNAAATNAAKFTTNAPPSASQPAPGATKPQ